MDIYKITMRSHDCFDLFSFLCVQNGLKYFLKTVLIQMNLILLAKNLHCDLLALENKELKWFQIGKYLFSNSVMNGIAEIDFVQLDAELINEFIILVQLLFLMTLKSLIFQG